MTTAKVYKKDFEYSYTIGIYPTLELLKKNPAKVLEIILASNTEESPKITEIKSICMEENIPISFSNKLVNRISNSENAHVLGVFDKFEAKLEQNQNHLVLVNPSDMGNLGTIIRTMCGFGFNNLAIIKPACDIFNPKVIRASMGSIFQINFQYFENFEDYKNEFNNNLYAFVLNSEKSLETTKFENSYSLVFGNEGAGLNQEIIDKCNPIKISQSSNVDSLNLSVAVGIVLHNAYSLN